VFESLPSSIESVHINLTNNRIAKNQLFNFVNRLEHLNALRIYGVDVEATEVKKLLEKHRNSIISLALVDCSIKDDGIETIMVEIQQCQSLEELDLSKNPLKEEGLRRIDNMLVNINRTIKLRLFELDPVQLTNPFKKIMPYHFSSVS
jgi:Ran GTPase-activating protein (RanGAP) involved in mRNA processing and transport